MYPALLVLLICSAVLGGSVAILAALFIRYGMVKTWGMGGLFLALSPAVLVLSLSTLWRALGM